MGIEPTSKAWEALVLPMNYARGNVTLHSAVATRRLKIFNSPPRLNLKYFLRSVIAKCLKHLRDFD